MSKLFYHVQNSETYDWAAPSGSFVTSAFFGFHLRVPPKKRAAQPLLQMPKEVVVINPLLEDF
jgi:hypothetical protein